MITKVNKIKFLWLLSDDMIVKYCYLSSVDTTVNSDKNTLPPGKPHKWAACRRIQCRYEPSWQSDPSRHRQSNRSTGGVRKRMGKLIKENNKAELTLLARVR